MATSVLVVAESGSGKSTSIESLNSKETFIINVSSKPLPFKGWKSKYSVWSKENPNGNLYNTANPDHILACLKYVHEKRPEIKTVVVDDMQYMSAFEYFDKAMETGFAKFTSISTNLAKVARFPKDLREDLQVYFLTHAEESVDMDGKKRVKAKTLGKMIDNSLTLEGLFSIVLFGKVKKDKETKQLSYIFETQNNGDNTCKSPKGMFDEVEIPNSLEVVRQAIIDFEN